jgi:hypothetical protein
MIFSYDEVFAKLSRNIEAWFYGKLLLAALAETLVNMGRFSSEFDDDEEGYGEDKQFEQNEAEDQVDTVPISEQVNKIPQPKSEKDIRPERFSLWRELRAAYTLIVSALLEGLNKVSFLKHLKRLRYDCADSKRKRIPQLHILHIFSSA